MQPTDLISKTTLLSEARLLVSKPAFDREDSARVNALLGLADRLDVNGAGHGADPELRSFETALRSLGPGDKRVRWSSEGRDMSTGGGNVLAGSGGGYLVPVGFRQALAEAMKAYDRLFDGDVVTLFETERGGPCALPFIDDAASSATVISEGQQTSEVGPTPGGVALSNAPTFRSGIVTLSFELLQDSGFRPVDWLARAFAVRFARGAGAALVTSLLASAKQGAVASGDKNAAGGTAANSIGYQDLLALRTSVNPAYRASSKVFWLMNDNTLSALDGLLDKQGRPILDPDDFDENGNRLLLGYPVGLCPSLDNLGSGKRPILFGATDYFVVRTVPPATQLKPLTEQYAEKGLVAFQGYWRGNGGLTCASGSDSPVKYLQSGS